MRITSSESVLRIAVVVLVTVGRTASVAGQTCDYGAPGTESDWDCTGKCDGNNPAGIVPCTKSGGLRGMVGCQELDWKAGEASSGNWLLINTAICGNAPAGQPPDCKPAVGGTVVFNGFQGNNLKWRWSVREATWNGTACGLTDLENIDEVQLSKSGCCATLCQDPSGCEQGGNRVYTAATCTCAQAPSCENEENCIGPGPACEDGTWLDVDCDCCKPDGSPIIVDLADNNLRFSSPREGMVFDLFACGKPVRVSWPLDERAYWLALDRNRNGVIDSGAELFGNVTMLLDGTRARHGYIALAEFDTNRDGRIDGADPVFNSLVLWRRPLPTGTAPAADEYRSLRTAGVKAISLEVFESRRRDRWGNELKYRARVQLRDGRVRWSYDVFLVYGSPGT